MLRDQGCLENAASDGGWSYCLQQDGFVQMSIVKIQPQPAKMPVVMVSLQVKTVLALIHPKPNSMENKT
jgi:hypothetical protein